MLTSNNEVGTGKAVEGIHSVLTDEEIVEILKKMAAKNQLKSEESQNIIEVQSDVARDDLKIADRVQLVSNSANLIGSLRPKGKNSLTLFATNAKTAAATSVGNKFLKMAEVLLTEEFMKKSQATVVKKKKKLIIGRPSIIVTTLLTGFLIITGMSVSFYKNKNKVVTVSSTVTETMNSVPEGTSVTDSMKSISTPASEIVRQQVEVSRSRSASNYVAPKTTNSGQYSMAIGKGEFKSYMDYQKINKSSVQGKYIASNMTIQDNGLLMDNEGFVGVAMGSYFGPIGSKFEIKLSSGNIINVVKVEAKSDAHTRGGCVDSSNGSVLEIVGDTNLIRNGQYQSAYERGSFNVVPEFNGTITQINAISLEQAAGKSK